MKDKDYELVAYDKNQKTFVPIKVTKLAVAVFLVFLGFFIIWAWPFAVVWSINNLFSLKIPYDFWSWLSCVVILTTISFRNSPITVSKKNTFVDSSKE